MKVILNEYIFCSVVFYEGGKSYYYLSNNPSLRCGDYVTVSVGKNNEEKTGIIVKIEIFRGNNAPIPVQILYVFCLPEIIWGARKKIACAHL